MILPDNFSLHKYGLFIRLVNKEDANFIIELRSNQKRNQHIHETSRNYNKQKEWIAAYKERQILGIEYYFIVCNSNSVPYGTTRLYNFSETSFETGSWVFLEDSPFGMAVLGDIIGREIAFELLGFKVCKFEVRKENKNVLQHYHYKYEPRLIKEDDLNYYFELSKEQFFSKRNIFLKLLGYGT